MCLLVLGAGHAVAQSALPAGWSSRDIGSTGVAGSTSVASGTWTVRGSGANIWGSSDELQFAYQQITGDFDVRVRISSLENVNAWSKAGLMVRESLNANARNAFVMVTPSNGRYFQFRTATGGSTTRRSAGSGTTPVWLRLVRQGTRFTGYLSTDGSSWTSAGGSTISMTSAAYIGLAVGSRDDANDATAVFTSYQTASGLPAPSALPTPWTNRDIGSPPVAGSASEAAGTFTVTSGGGDIWSNVDQFHFVSQPLQGDVEIIARVASLQYASAWSKAGVMIRESLSAGSRQAFMMISGTEGYGFQRRIETGAGSYHTDGPSGSAPGWVRLVREGTLFSAYQSADGVTWRLVGTDTIAMASTVYAGLAVSSDDPGAATGSFTNVAARSVTAGSNQTPTVSITGPADGATFTAGTSFTLTAAASDTDGTVSKVDLFQGSQLLKSDTTSPYSVSVTMSTAGTYSFTAVATDSDGATATSAAVNVTVGGTTNQPPTVSLTSPAAGATFTAPASIALAATASDTDGTVSSVDFYQGSTLLGSDTTSPYSFTWSNVAAGSYSVTAIARDNNGATRTSSAVSVTVNSATNQAPSVSLTAPASGASFTAGANITLSATASDSDGTVARVEFYRGTTLIGTDTTSPYSAVWTGSTAGTYSLTARAVDNAGATRTSSAVSVTVTAAANQLPTVSITSPIAGQSFAAPASLTIAASASDSDGTISGVDFYVGSQLIASDTSSPYSASWTNVAAGSYSLTAVARDNSGGTRTSTAVSVTVTAAAPRPTTLVFTASADHATNVTSYTVAVYRSADPVTGSPVATRDLGKPTPVNGDISVDISTLIDPLPAGTYKTVVRAIGPGGTTASAPSVDFTK